jgi:hypothetical protein
MGVADVLLQEYDSKRLRMRRDGLSAEIAKGRGHSRRGWRTGAQRPIRIDLTPSPSMFYFTA